MNRLSYIFLPLTAIGMSACSSGKEEVKRPNIIFMMTDDHTTQAMSCYGGRFLQTPNMDRIANEGVRMDNCYAVNALSGPSRACILTGKFSHINGFTDNASTFSGDVSTGTHCYSNIRGCKSDRVVNAVTGESDPFAFLLQIFD